MKLVCPCCNKKILLSEAEITGVLVDMVEVAARIGAHWDLVDEYVDCFRPADGQVNLKRRIRILKEIAQLIEKQEFEYDRKKYRIKIRNILWGMRIVCDMQKYGLNHNYLKKVMINSCGAERLSAEGLTAKQEDEYRISNVERRTTNKEDLGTMKYPEYLAKGGERLK